MDEKVTEILKAIHKLNPAEKHRLREFLIEKLTAWKGNLIQNTETYDTLRLNKFTI